MFPVNLRNISLLFIFYFSVVREDAVKKVAWSLIIAYSKAFGCITCDEEEKTHVVANLTCSLLNRVNYKRRKCDKRGSKRKRPCFSTPEEYAQRMKDAAKSKTLTLIANYPALAILSLVRVLILVLMNTVC